MNQNAKFNASLALLFILTFSFFIALFYSFQFLFVDELGLVKKETVLGAVTNAQPSSIKTELPLRISIPSININASIQQVGITSRGIMEVPSNATDTGWYRYGSVPGENGSAVIAGHYDGKNGTKGVFEKLHLLNAGDKIYIVLSSGNTKSFTVRESRMYNPEADASAVFNQIGGNYLNLITCSGLWDDAQKSYSKRLVVFTDASP